MPITDSPIILGEHLRTYDTNVAVLLDCTNNQTPLILFEGGFGGGSHHVSLAQLIDDPGRIEHAYACGVDWLVELGFEERKCSKRFSPPAILDHRPPSSPETRLAHVQSTPGRSSLVKRWKSLSGLRDRSTNRIRYELGKNGRLFLFPPNPSKDDFLHQLQKLFSKHLSGGVLPTCPVLTRDGIFCPELSWFKSAETTKPSPFLSLPDICLDILDHEQVVRHGMLRRFALFHAGVAEYWSCSLSGRILFHNPSDLMERSRLCPTFPAFIDPAPMTNEGEI